VAPIDIHGHLFLHLFVNQRSTHPKKWRQKVDAIFFVLGFQLLASKVGDQVQNKLPWSLVQLSSLELESFKRGQGKFSCFGWAPKNL
jgi:hypothetical protein